MDIMQAVGNQLATIPNLAYGMQDMDNVRHHCGKCRQTHGQFTTAAQEPAGFMHYMHGTGCRA